MCAGWLQWCHLLPTGGFQSTQRTVTFSRSSPPSLLPQGMSKSRCSLRAPRSDSMVSGGICTISPSVEKKKKMHKNNSDLSRNKQRDVFLALFGAVCTFNDAGLGDEARRGFQGSVEHHETGAGHC